MADDPPEPWKAFLPEAERRVQSDEDSRILLAKPTVGPGPHLIPDRAKINQDAGLPRTAKELEAAREALAKTLYRNSQPPDTDDLLKFARNARRARRDDGPNKGGGPTR